MPDNKTPDLNTLIREVRSLTSEVRNNNNRSKRSALCDAQVNLWTWGVLTVLISFALSWTFPVINDLHFGRVMVGVALVLFLVWLILKLYCWSASTYNRKPYSSWNYPRSFSDYAIIVLLIVVVLLLWSAFGPSPERLSSIYGNLNGWFMENTPLGTIRSTVSGTPTDEDGSGDITEGTPPAEVNPGGSSGTAQEANADEDQVLTIDIVGGKEVDEDGNIYNILADGSKVQQKRLLKCWSKKPYPSPAACNTALVCRTGLNPETGRRQTDCAENMPTSFFPRNPYNVFPELSYLMLD